MTGYGAGAAEAPGARVTVEIRGVNQRVLDAKVAVPREYAAWETEIREGVRKTAERRREGAHLERDMRRRTTQLRALTARIRRRLPQALAALRRQEEDRLVRLVGGSELDPGRIAHEVAMLAERGDITEELVRLES